MATAFEKAGVEVTGGTDSNWLTTVLSWVIPILFFIILWSFLFRRFAERQGMGGHVNIGKIEGQGLCGAPDGSNF